MGADDYLRKPVTSAELRAAIASRLRKQEVTINNFVTGEIDSQENLEDRMEQLQNYSEAQSSLFHFLLQGIKPSISQLNQELEGLKETTIDSQQEEHLNNLQKEFTRLLAVVNQVSELHKILTPENTNVLSQFSFFEHEK